MMKTPQIFPVMKLRLMACFIVLGSFSIPASARAALQNILNFSFDQQAAIGAPVQAGDGNYYVAASSTDPSNRGAIIRITPAGTIATVHSFTGGKNGDGGPPVTPLTLGSDGALYGATASTFFRVTTAGGFQTLTTFDSSMGKSPVGNLRLGGDGAIYAACSSGGVNDKGSLLKWSAAGGVSLLVSFDGISAMGAEYPRTGLCQDADGNLYGEADNSGDGVIFKYSATTGLSALAPLDGATTGSNVPYGSNVVLGPDGKIYVATDFGGSDVAEGTVFRVSTAGVVEVVYAFGDYVTDGQAVSNPVFGSDGNLYGLNVGGPKNTTVAYRLTPTGQYVVLNNNFPEATYGDGGAISLTSDGDFIAAGSPPYGIPQGGNIFKLRSSDGASSMLGALAYSSPIGATPNAVLAIAPDGGIYGTTQQGGNHAHGVLFQIAPGGAAHAVSDFPSADTNLQFPSAGLVRGLDWSYYGLASYGATIYRYAPGSSPTLFFSGQPGLNLPVPATDGTFYGSGSNGGDNDNGAIYTFSSTGVADTPASFDYAATGAQPQGPLILAGDGNYYGVCNTGGANDAGTIFKITPAGALSLVASFDSNTTGGCPVGPLVQARDGNFYGVTSLGGPNDGVGTIFRATPAGNLTVVTTFDAARQGGSPQIGLTLGSDGMLYGTTNDSGPKGGGTLFKATLGGQITVLTAFDPAINGTGAGQVLQTSDGSLYVALAREGLNGGGAIVQYSETAPTPAPLAAPKIAGKSKVTTSRPSVTIGGTLATAGAYVEYAIGKGKFKKAKGGAKWRFTARLKPGKNTISVRSYDPATGETSVLKKIVVIRR